MNTQKSAEESEYEEAMLDMRFSDGYSLAMAREIIDDMFDGDVDAFLDEYDELDFTF